jgi:hypothetical protein
MNRRHFLGALSVAPLAGIPAPGEALAIADADGFVLIFNGRDLDGWTVTEGPESAFSVADGAIVVNDSASYPTWLRSNQQYENFDFRAEFYMKDWIDSGIYLHAPENGRPTWVGMQVKLFHQVDEKPMSNSMGSIFPLVAPRKVNVKSNGDWNDIRILMDWPSLRVWTNGELIQDLNVEENPELRHRFRRGYLGLASLSYPIRFRNLRILELPSKDRKQVLYKSAADFDGWYVSENKPNFQPMGRVLRGDGVGHLATKGKYRDFELTMYVRGQREHNSGVLFRTEGKGLSGKYYEIQLHNVEDAHYPTGSLYHFKRSTYPRMEPEVWFPLQMLVKDAYVMVRINGDTVVEYDRLENLDAGHIELQAHRQDYWTEFKEIEIKTL